MRIRAKYAIVWVQDARRGSHPGLVGVAQTWLGPGGFILQGLGTMAINAGIATRLPGITLESR